MFLLYHAYVYLEFLILACTIYILATTYYKYDKGWGLSDISVNDSKEWIIAPTKGVNKKQIIASLVSQDVKTDGGAWTIEDGEISDVAIKQQDTDLSLIHI